MLFHAAHGETLGTLCSYGQLNFYFLAAFTRCCCEMRWTNLMKLAHIHRGICWLDHTCSLLQPHSPPHPSPLTPNAVSLRCAGIPGPRGYNPRCPPPAGVGDGSEGFNRKSPPLLTFGLIVDATFAGRLVDKGPPAEDGPAARKFREFWGDKSELRRCVRLCACPPCPERVWGCWCFISLYLSPPLVSRCCALFSPSMTSLVYKYVDAHQDFSLVV